MNLVAVAPSETPLRQRRALTPDSLFEYANSYARASEVAGNGTRYPTFRAAARHFRVRLSDIEDACENYIGDNYMKPAVGFRSPAGWGSHATMGDWLVEAFRES